MILLIDCIVQVEYNLNGKGLGNDLSSFGIDCVMNPIRRIWLLLSFFHCLSVGSLLAQINLKLLDYIISLRINKISPLKLVGFFNFI